jgi:hypothetical protein
MYVTCGVVTAGYSIKYIAVTPEEMSSKFRVMEMLSVMPSIRKPYILLRGSLRQFCVCLSCIWLSASTSMCLSGREANWKNLLRGNLMIFPVTDYCFLDLLG